MSDAVPEASSRVSRRETRRSQGNGFLLFLRDLVIILVVALFVSFLLKTFLIRSFFIPSSSMEDTLHVDDRIIVNQLVPDVMPVEYGDVVVFRDPGGWLTPTPQTGTWIQQSWEWFLSLIGLAAPDSNDHLIKRVIGLPGDVVSCCDATGHLTINGIPIDEPYILIPEGADAAPTQFEVTVPDGQMWVMGDNRYNSRDSLGHIDDPGSGFVPIDHIVGKALVISWPTSRWSVLDNYPTTFEGVESARSTAP